MKRFIFILVIAVGAILYSSRTAPAANPSSRNVIDTHAHILPWPDGQASVVDATVQRAVSIMDENGIARSVDLSGGFGQKLKDRIALYQRLAPGRFTVFTNMDFSKVNDPQFSKKA